MTAFSEMLGSVVLSHLRDVLIDVAAKKRSFLEQSAAVGGMPVTKDELQEARAIEAAADCLQFAVSTGQDAKGKGRDPPEWVMRMAAQARVALVEETAEG